MIFQQNILQQFKPSKVVVETHVSTSECPTIDSIKEKLATFKYQKKPENHYTAFLMSRRILFCPSKNTWVMILFLEDTKDGSAYDAITEHFSDLSERVFNTSTFVRMTSAESYDELQAEANGCLRVLDKNFTDENWQHFNIEAVTSLLSKIIH